MAEPGVREGLSQKQRFMKRWNMLRSERATWLTDYLDLVDYVSPMSGRFVSSEANKGNKVRRSKKLYDNTGKRSLNVLAAGLMAGMTSPARPWFRLAIADKALMEREDVKTWLQSVTEMMRDIFARSNTYRALHQAYMELGAFGVACDVVRPNFDNVVHHFPLTVGEYCLATNDLGLVDTLYREFNMTVGQLVKQFGRENCSQVVQGHYDRGNVDQWIQVHHVIEPRVGRDLTKRDAKNMKFISAYYETSTNGDDKMLGESGFKRFPALCPRWSVTGNDVYGTGPGHDALSDIRQLQHDALRRGQAIDYQTNPPLQAPTSLKDAGINRLPGGLQYVDSVGSDNAIRTMFDVKLDLRELRESTNDIRHSVKAAFYEDLFLMLANDTRSGITATEVAERHEEKLLMLGPVLERLHNEMLDPLIDTTFEEIVSAGAIPPPPPCLQQGAEIVVQYVSMLAQAQRAVGLASFDRMISTVGALAGAKQDPTVWDKIDTDQMIDEYGDGLGVTPRVIRSDDVVAGIRADRAKAQQAQQALAAAQSMAQTAQTASQADPAKMQDVMGMFSGYGSPTATEVGVA